MILRRSNCSSQLRESDPENAEINISLARLAANLGEHGGAVHYYQNALYGRWTGDQVDERRRQLRKELVRFLLQHQQLNLASSELLILEAGIPDTAACPCRSGQAVSLKPATSATR